jgi:hypothetical protein
VSNDGSAFPKRTDAPIGTLSTRRAKTELEQSGQAFPERMRRGFDIECSWSPAGGITCVGPQGGYNGQDLAALVSAACGCG